jgi:hypothetical protein
LQMRREKSLNASPFLLAAPECGPIAAHQRRLL